MTSPIIDFLEARLEEDRALAQAAIDDPYGSGDCWFDTSNAFIADHYLRHEPYRVLREVQAKRAMMELHGRSHECSTYDHHGDIESCSWCLNPEDCSTLLALAAIYSDHPDYRKEWAA